MISPWLAIPASLIFILLVWFITSQIANVTPIPAQTAAEGLEDKIGEAKTDIYPEEGSVQIGGQLWSARSQTPIKSGDLVRVLRVDGFTLVVAPAPKEQ